MNVVLEGFVANLAGEILDLAVALGGVVQQVAPVDEYLGALGTAVGRFALRGSRCWRLELRLLRLKQFNVRVAMDQKMLSNFERFRADRAGVGSVLLVLFEQFFVLVVNALRGTLDLTKVDWDRCDDKRAFVAGVFLLDFLVVVLLLLLELNAILASVEKGQSVPEKLIVGHAPLPESHVLVQLVGAQFAHEHGQVALVNYLYRRAVVNLLGEQNVRK